jgi:hypothetical protein
VLSLGLDEPLTPLAEMEPGPVDLSKTPMAAMPAAVVLPAAMAAALK